MLNGRRAAIVLFLLTGAVTFKAVLCITIDNQLQVIRNDCYERLAIGQRLDQKDVYRKTNSNTVTDCQMECTHDEGKCRSFSFGIGVKGNSSCELSTHIVKESVDLKPIGTTDDTDFDLYIKKLGCKLVIDLQPNLPEFANDEPYESEEMDKPKSRPRPGSYKKHQGGFQYGSEHQSSYNSQSHFSMKKLYKGNRPINDDDRAVSYNRYEKPAAASYDKPDKYEYQADQSNSYDNSDKFSFTNPYDDLDGPTYYKPQHHYDSNEDERKPPSNAYGNDGNKRPNSDYNYSPTTPSPPSFSGYESDKPSNKPNYDSNPKPPFRPSHLNNPYSDEYNGYHQKPSRPQYHDPDNPNYDSHRPPSHADSGGYGLEKPQKQPPKFDDGGGYQYKKPSTSGGYNYDKPSQNDDVGGYVYLKPGKPSYGSGVKPVFEMEESDAYEYPKRPNFPGGLYGVNRPPHSPNPGSSYGGSPYHGQPEIYSPKYPYKNPIIKDDVDPYGHLVTSIITEIGNVCFRRAIAGKRVSRIFVRKVVSCERIEHCQQECAEEKRFICEGFNYRLDSSGHGRGDCELLDVPHIRLDLRRDIIPDPDYDYYEKDRNCKEHQGAPPYRPSGGDRLPGPPRPPLHDWHSSGYSDRYSSRDRFRDRYDERASFDRRGSEYDLSQPLSRPYNRRNDYIEESFTSRDKYEDHYNSYDYRHHYSLPNVPFEKDYDYKSYEPYLPPRNGYDNTNSWIKHKYDVKPYYDKASDRPPHDNTWGVYGGSYGDFGGGYSGYGYVDRNYDIKGIKHDIPRPSSPKHWGEYGGTYGTGGYYYNYQASDYEGINKVNDHKFTSNKIYNDGPEAHFKPSQEYLPPTYPPTADYLPSYGSHDTSYKYERPAFGGLDYPKAPPLTFVNECSLRSATGYRLYKNIVKKILTVPTIYDCEYACFKEKDFICTSYAFRYVIDVGIPPNNCYLSNKNYKELNYYTDLEQDRNFDIYTMNNRGGCDGGSPHPRDSSECFLHVRSSQRIDDKCIKESFTVKSIVDCELACLKSTRFICRTFSFRYGSAIIGGAAENCQLTDIPYHELDPKQDFIFEPGFIVYERASFGYGCELNQLPSLHNPKPSTVSLNDETCYIGFGWPAKLLPQSIKKILRVDAESECKIECTRARMETPFCCMTFSYKSAGLKGEPNCFLSDIYQRDLLENIDYGRSSDHWLFSWDNTSPQCNIPAYYEQQLPLGEKYDFLPGSLTWRIYSVGGWPCKRGSFCKQSELGFWFCELEGGSPSSWDYCCRPKHQCGYSEGFPYQWCYVGSSSTQWRKCNDKYYPYLPSPRPPEHYIPTKPPKPTFIPHIPSKPSPGDYDSKPPSYVPTTFIPPPTIHVEPPKKTYLPPSINKPRPWITTNKPFQSGLQPPLRPGFRPDRPQAPSPPHKPMPTLNEYEEQFDNFFLDPPKPGGFGQARHWPVSYLHKEMPPNARLERFKMEDDAPVKPRIEALQNLIEVFQANDLNNIKYQISNTSDRNDDVLHVQIPLPNKFSETLDGNEEDKLLLSHPIDLPAHIQNSINMTKIENNDSILGFNTADTNAKEKNNVNRNIYRRGFIQKTNITNYGRSL